MADGRRSECKSCFAARARQLHRATRITVPDPGPARALRVTLHRLRDDGVSFELAWPQAVNRALTVAGDPSWAGAFRWSMEAWRGAYEGRPPVRGERMRIVPDDLTAA